VTWILIAIIIGLIFLVVDSRREIKRLHRQNAFQQRLLLLGKRLGTHNEVPTQRGRHDGGE